MVFGNLRPKLQLDPVGAQAFWGNSKGLVGRDGIATRSEGFGFVSRPDWRVKPLLYSFGVLNIVDATRLRSSSDTSHCRDGIIVCELGSQEMFTMGWQQEFFGPLVMLGLLGLVLTGIIGLSSLVSYQMLWRASCCNQLGFPVGDFIDVQGISDASPSRIIPHGNPNRKSPISIQCPISFWCQPSKSSRSSGTIVSATVSLGYDTSHSRLEALLKEAAKRAGLGESFVQVVDLGDFSVNYRLAGFLER